MSNESEYGDDDKALFRLCRKAVDGRGDGSLESIENGSSELAIVDGGGNEDKYSVGKPSPEKFSQKLIFPNPKTFINFFLKIFTM